MPAKVFKTFADVQKALQTFVQGPPPIPIASAVHGNMWENGDTPDAQYNYFVTGDAITGYPILQKGNGKASNIIKALSGTPPFDGNTPPLKQMPPNGPYLDQETIDAISAWIDAGANQ